MRTKLFTSLSVVVLAASAVASAQTPQQPPAQRPSSQQPPTTPSATPPAQPSTPPAGTQPYKPDFEIPKAGQPGLPEPVSGTQVPPERYVIGAQDQLSIVVTDETDLTGQYRVDNDGTITLPYLSRVPIAGMTLADAQTKLTSMLQAGYLNHPQVRVEVVQYKSRSVLVTGEVRTPGRVTMASTTMSLLEALALAGSPTSSAANDVIVVHNGKPNEPIYVNRKDLELGRAGLDVVLGDGDIINVPTAKRYYIQGFIRNPGSYVLDIGKTI